MSSPNMNLPIPVPTVTDGPQYAIDEVGCFNKIDSHNHTSGQGVPVPVDGIQIDNNLPMNSFGLTSASSVGFQNQLSSPGFGKIYMSGNDLYWTNGTGAYNVQITTTGSVNSGAGSITGLPSGTASAAYISGSGTFQFRSATNTAADVDGRSVILRNSTVSSFGMTVAPPSAMSQDYTVTLPVPPAVTSFMSVDSTGAVSASIPTALGIDTGNIANSAITNIKMAANSVDTNQIVNASVTQSKLAPVSQQISASCGSFSTNSTSFVDVTNLSVTITTTGRPVFIYLQPDGTTGLVGSSIGPTSTSTDTFVVGYLAILRGSTLIADNQLILFSGIPSSGGPILGVPCSSVFFIDPVAAGTYTYKIQAKATSGDGMRINYAKLIAFEI